MNPLNVVAGWKPKVIWVQVISSEEKNSASSAILVRGGEGGLGPSISVADHVFRHHLGPPPWP